MLRPHTMAHRDKALLQHVIMMIDLESLFQEDEDTLPLSSCSMNELMLAVGSRR